MAYSELWLGWKRSQKCVPGVSARARSEKPFEIRLRKLLWDGRRAIVRYIIILYIFLCENVNEWLWIRQLATCCSAERNTSTDVSEVFSIQYLAFDRVVVDIFDREYFGEFKFLRSISI